MTFPLRILISHKNFQCKFIRDASEGGNVEWRDTIETEWGDCAVDDSEYSCNLGFSAYWPKDEDLWTLDEALSPGTSACSERLPYAARHSVTHVLAAGDVRVVANTQPWSMQPEQPPTLPTFPEAEQSKAHMMNYAADILQLQHRTHVFMFFIYQTFARPIFVDRNHVVLCESLDLEKDCDKFAEFFYRLARATPDELGLDPTATRLPKNLSQHADFQALQEVLGSLTTPRTEERIAAAFDDEDNEWPVYRLSVIDSSGTSETLGFLVRKPSTGITSLLGRATRGYIAFDIAARKFCFLKDYWRPDAPDILPEYEVHKRLQKHDVKFVATVRCAGDVPNQRTKSQTFLATDDVPPLLHTRLVVVEVGIPLREYESSYELCAAILYAFLGGPLGVLC